MQYGIHPDGYYYPDATNTINPGHRGSTRSATERDPGNFLGLGFQYIPTPPNRKFNPLHDSLWRDTVAAPPTAAACPGAFATIVAGETFASLALTAPAKSFPGERFAPRSRSSQTDYRTSLRTLDLIIVDPVHGGTTVMSCSKAGPTHTR